MKDRQTEGRTDAKIQLYLESLVPLRLQCSAYREGLVIQVHLGVPGHVLPAVHLQQKQEAVQRHCGCDVLYPNQHLENMTPPHVENGEHD